MIYLFILFDIFWWTEVFNFSSKEISLLLHYECFWCLVLKKNPSSVQEQLVYSVVSHNRIIPNWFSDPFGIIFAYYVKQGSNFTFFWNRCVVIPELFIQNKQSFLLYMIYKYVYTHKNIIGLVSRFYFIGLFYFPATLSRCLNSSSAIIKLHNWWNKSSYFLKEYLGYSSSFAFLFLY